MKVCLEQIVFLEHLRRVHLFRHSWFSLPICYKVVTYFCCFDPFLEYKMNRVFYLLNKEKKLLNSLAKTKILIDNLYQIVK